MPPRPSFHFIAGLPRSGSTLLAALLRQNPRIHAGMTSGLGALVTGAMQTMSPGSEAALAIEDVQREDILRGLFDSYYKSLTDRPIVVDTNRGWSARMPLLAGLFPGSRVIACVRELSWVLDSIERQVRGNPYHFTRLFGPKSQGSVYSRAEALMQYDALVGRAYTGLKEAFYGEQSASLLIIEYELLAREPQKILPLVYEFLQEPAFEHDFDNVEYEAADYDEALGVSGLHSIRRKVGFEPRATILPPDLFRKYDDMCFWRDRSGSAAHVVVGRRNAPQGPASTQQL